MRRTRLLLGMAAAATLAATLALAGSVTLFLGVMRDAALVNEAGIVRGSMQRAAKWMLAEGPDSEGSAIEAEAALLEAESRLAGDARARAILPALRSEWEGLRAAAAAGGDDAALLERSERLWALTMAFVRGVQASSESRAAAGGWLALGLLGLLCLSLAVAILVRSWVAGRLEEASIRDALTGLFNRRFFALELEREALRAERSGRPLALLALDLDRFKEVNDLLGHAAGDAVLRAAARALASATRKSDLVARLGGDEFAVILPDTDRDDALAVARKTVNALRELGEEGRGVTASAGVAVRGPDEGAASLLAAADAALYRAKAAGRDRASD